MTRYLKGYLNVTELQHMGGEYVGVIESVTDTVIRNRYTKRPSQEAVVQFPDGKRLVLNIGMVRECIQLFGAESAAWPGHRVRVFLYRAESLNKETGETRVAWHRKICGVGADNVASPECDDSAQEDLTADQVFGKKGGAA